MYIECHITKNLSKNTVWWGFSQWYKWRWNKTHIDLGIMSTYKLKQMWFWSCVAFLIWPLRLFYHTFYACGLKSYMKGVKK
jgi:hypothetical protein